MKRDINKFQKYLSIGLLVVFLVSFYGVANAEPFVENITLTADSGGLACSYYLYEDPDMENPLTAATAWYNDRYGELEPIMILYMPFEGGETNALVDYSGNDAIVSTSGDPVWVSDGGHDGHGAYDFDGNDYLDAGDIFPTESSYTKTAWIYRTDTTSNHNIISGDTHAEYNHCFKVDPDGRLNAGHYYGIPTVSDSTSMDEAQWYFVTVTYNHETGDMILYKDGVFVGSAIETRDATDSGVQIGAMANGYNWEGMIDDARIYDHVLSPDQIRFMFEYGHAIAPTEVREGEEWQADVTPFSPSEAGETVSSDIFTVGDDDSDGVLNAVDNCPDTPAGEEVDENGCSLSQLDTDGDGVSDADDLCPGYDDNVDVDQDGIPDGCDTLIDSDGDGVADADDLCPGFDDNVDIDQDGIPDGCDTLIDSDGDGVADADDLCPGTPAGVTVDSNGCSASQLDSDGDGVSDADDLCPGFDDNVDIDQDGIPDGCDTLIDSDGDGVADADDLCPGFDDNVDVDQDGIPDGCDSLIDSDGDGVADADDLCPGTPAGEAVNENGCSLSQIDTDEDGVYDDIDNCLNTPNYDQADFDQDDIGDVCDDDNDNDGVPDDEEVGPDGDPDYDGNGDTIADRLQPNVVSGYTYDDAYYVTLAVTAPVGAALTYADVLEPPAELPEGTEFPYGVFAFTIENLVDGTATVELHLPEGESPNTYYKYGRTQDNDSDHWYEFMYDDTTGTGAEIIDNVITLHFVDGARGDDDLIADGVIMDDGAPALSDTSGEEEPDVPAAGGGGGGGGCFISTADTGTYAAAQLTLTLLLGFALATLVRFEMKRNNK